MTPTPSETQLVLRALEVAAEAWGDCAERMRQADNPRLVEQFEQQRRDALALRARLEAEGDEGAPGGAW